MDKIIKSFSFKDYSGFHGETNHKFATSSIKYKLLKKLSERSFRSDRLKQLIVNDASSAEEDDFKLFDFRYVEDDMVEIRTRGLIGVVQTEVELAGELGGETQTYEVKLEIGSRFDEGDRQYFLQHMLQRASGVLLHDDAPPAAIDSVFDLLLLFVFKQQLEDAYRQGLYKVYVKREHNDSRVKGAIDVPRHIRLNTPFQGKVAYDTREHSCDNDMLHLILHAYRRLMAKYPEHTRHYLMSGQSVASQAIRSIREACPGFGESQPARTAARCRTRIAHPYFQCYEPLRITCLHILADMGVSLFDGDGERIKGVLFYVPKLWEQYLAGAFADFAVKEQEECDIFIPVGSSGGPKIKPDFVFYGDAAGDSAPKLILDAKYKPRWNAASQGRGFEAVRGDYLQVVNYMVSFRTDRGGVVFPVKEDRFDGTAIREFKLSTFEEDKRFYTVALSVPSSKPDEDYAGWSKRLEDSVSTLVLDMKEKNLLGR